VSKRKRLLSETLKNHKNLKWYYICHKDEIFLSMLLLPIVPAHTNTWLEVWKTYPTKAVKMQRQKQS